jgi:rubrerythrin
MSNVHLLETAMLKELAAREFYRQIAQRISDHGGKEKFLQLSREEGHHFDILRRWYAGDAGKEFDESTACCKPTYPFPDKAVFESTSAMEALSVGITSEKEAMEFYQSFRDQVTDLESKKTLSQLIQFEEGHLHRLQSEYDSLLHHFYWI